MIIAVISDTHDNVWNLSKALGAIEERKAEVLIHCGDYCAPFIIDQLSQFSGPMHGVFGNVDGDIYLLTTKSTSTDNITLHGRIADVEIDGKKIAVHHFPDLARSLAASGDYNVVFYGHTHVQSVEELNETKLVNPGEIMGNKGEPSFCLYDTETGEIERIALKI